MKTVLKTTLYTSLYGMAISCLALLATPQDALAQGGAAKSLDEITATACRREKSLREVPIAVSAYSGDMLEEVGAVVGVGVGEPLIAVARTARLPRT